MRRFPPPPQVREQVRSATEASAVEARRAAFTRAAPPQEYAALLEDARAQHAALASPVCARAFEVVSAFHAGQTRRNGEPVVAHLLATACILAAAGLDERVVAAGLLHDVIDDTPLSEHRLRALLPQDGDIVDMVLGVSKLSNISQLSRDAAAPLSAAENAKLRSMLLAMGDPRVVFIKVPFFNLELIGHRAPFKNGPGFARASRTGCRRAPRRGRTEAARVVAAGVTRADRSVDLDLDEPID